MATPASTALAAARPAIFWTDNDDGPDPAPQLRWEEVADLAIIGGGLTGLWAAILATEADPGRSVAVIEAERAGFGASSRNGGFLSASITHGLGNGLSHWPGEIDQLIRLGRENYAEILSFLTRHEADAGLEETGTIHIATEPWHLDDLSEMHAHLAEHGLSGTMLDGEAMRAEIASPTYVGGLVEHDGMSIVDPAKLVWALRAVAEARGVSVFENSQVVGVERSHGRMRVRTASGSVVARKVLVATNAYAQPVKAMRRFIVPVYDYVLMTEPLSAEHVASIGWRGRQGLGDVSNQFHYYRLTTDNRILWGGYDAIYRYGSPVSAELDQKGTTHQTLAEHFFTTFPQLEDLSFTHRWAGPIGTTSRFTATWGTGYDGDLAWVGGYTGLGVGATRFGANVALDLLEGVETELTGLEMVRKRPLPFPPEPFRYAGIQLTRRALAKADDHGGRRGPWLKLLDRFGVGFDS